MRVRRSLLLRMSYADTSALAAAVPAVAGPALLDMRWPGRLPVPSVARSTATWQNVRLGVTVVSTAPATVMWHASPPNRFDGRTGVAAACSIGTLGVGTHGCFALGGAATTAFNIYDTAQAGASLDRAGLSTRPAWRTSCSARGRPGLTDHPVDRPAPWSVIRIRAGRPHAWPPRSGGLAKWPGSRCGGPLILLPNCSPLDENPIVGFTTIYTGSDVIAIGFGDNNGSQTYPVKLGWGVGPDHSIEQTC